QVVTVGGRLVQDEGASAGDVFVLDPLGARRSLTSYGVFGGGLRGFLVSQFLFLLMLTVALVAAVAAPTRRFTAVLASLRGAPAWARGCGRRGWDAWSPRRCAGCSCGRSSACRWRCWFGWRSWWPGSSPRRWSPPPWASGSAAAATGVAPAAGWRCWWAWRS